MESKKLQQFQYANSHLAPQKKLSLTYHQPPPNSMDEFHNMNYASTVFQNQHGQYHSVLPNFEQNHSKLNNQQTPSSSSSQLTPMDSSSQSLGQHNMVVKSSALQNVYQHQKHQMIKQQPQHHNPYGAEMLYQTPREARAYHIKALNSKAILDNNTDSKSSPVTSLQEQYQQLQQAKMCIQIQTQNEALVQQQKTFAMRQALNPPIPQTHFQRQNQYSGMSGSPSVQSNVNQESVQHQLPMMQSTHRNVPPTSLNLCTQFQPAQGPIKIDYGQTGKIQNHYHQANTYPGRQIQLEHNSFPQKQYNNLTVQNKSESAIIGTASGDPSPVYIQQNHPGHVVNQACQTQLSGGIGNKNVTPTSIKHKKTPTSSTEESSTSTTKSPSHAPAERKKSFGTIQALKSPITKRPESSTVTLSGWLYKQGSDGLKVWRKRWFVLSEYCLYYYKGPEEEKLLGSILLPSYIVSACLPEDKIYRKFAFKCEHTNMRTYWLAAENSEQMCQWVKALMAATLMQASSDSDQTSQPSFSSVNHTGENSDSGINTFQSNNKFTVQHPPITPVGPDNIGNAMQPLYANAPPKPRRINDGGYSSPSPDIDRNENSPNQQGRHIEHKSHHAIYDTRTGNVTSKLHVKNTSDNHMPPIQYQHHPSDILDNRENDKNSGYYIGNEPRTGIENDYRKSPSVQKLHHDQFNNPNSNLELQEMVQLFSQNRLNDEIYGDKNLYVQRQPTRPYNYVNTGSVITYPNVERRTPDAYGRSKSRLQGRFFSDYEDIYNLTQQEQHLQGIHPELAYRRPLSPPTYNNQKNIPPMPSRYTPNNLEVSHASNVNLRNKLLQPTGIARPHSADFLEYEARIEGAIQNKSETKRAPRPKSSLDINRAPDSYYYSEESYAEKMRQSALYLQKPQNPQQQQQQHPSPGTNLAPVVSSTLPTNYNNIRNQNMNHPYSSEMNIRFENTYGDNSRIKKQNDNYGGNTLIKGSESVPRLKTNTASSVLAKDYHLRLQQNEQFLRSASARLPKNCDTDETIGNSTTSLKEGERKREESMKRLLEWKQRMLQSPLTRKGVQINGSPSILKLGSNPNVLLSSQSNIQRSPSEPHTNIGYNSYSSDDEASISVRNVRNIPKYNFTAKPTSSSDLRINPNNQKYSNSYYGMNNYTNENYYPGDDELGIYHGMNNVYPIRKSGSRAEIDILERETSSQIRNLDMSAGDLLSRTHEELVLLLIQLRRQNSQTARTIEQCCTNIHEDQNRIRTTSGLTRAESIQRLDYLKQHLLDLEKQYEKSKPLVNLVDNMVKLGSLYRNNETNQRNESATLDRINFNQKIQERRLLEEEQIRWDRLSPNHNELQSKVNQLYELDQLLQEESGTLQILQKDKENLEVALSDLRARLQVSNDPPIILEAAKKQQLILEMELSRVHKLLAENSKKLEQTVAGNARLEQELLILRQKLQSTTTTGSRGSSHGGFNQNNSDSIQYESSTAILLESELKRVQKLVGDMQRQRQELSQTVQQLTANSNRLYQEIGNKDTTNTNNSNFTSQIKKRYNSSCWTETDLDSMATIDYTSSYSADGSNLSTPLYVDTNTSLNHINSNNRRTKYDNDNGQIYGYTSQDTEIMENSGVESDDLLETNPFANLSNQERQEIKTVRIVKRESERRQKDRERSGLVTATVVSSQNLNQVMEEESAIQNMKNRTKSLPLNYDILNNQTGGGKSLNIHENINASIYKQSGMSNTNNLPNVGAISYSDYYSTSLSNTKNPYPHLISDKNSNFVPSSATYNMHSKDLNPSNGTNRGEHAKIHTSSNGRQKTKTQSIQNPIFQSEAARQIISEMSGSASEDNGVTEKVPSAQKQRRAIPREKRKHFTTPSNVNHKAVQKVFMEQANQNNTNWRAKDDLDMEVALRPRINAPDVVRSALGQGEKISENTIDRLFGAPNKILIPERYIPEQAPELSPEEKKRRQEKVEAIKKMLSEAPINNDNNVTNPTTKITDEKKQREHLLQLNQILAQQVMQMSKIVAEKAMSTKRTELSNSLTSEEDHSSTSEDTLPIFQQRDNFFT